MLRLTRHLASGNEIGFVYVNWVARIPAKQRLVLLAEANKNGLAWMELEFRDGEELVSSELLVVAFEFVLETNCLAGVSLCT